MAIKYTRIYLKPDTMELLENAIMLSIKTDPTRGREKCQEEKTIHRALKYYLEN